MSLQVKRKKKYTASTLCVLKVAETKKEKKSKVAETAARNKAAHSSFLHVCRCLKRRNIILQRNRNGKTTSVMQTVLLLLLFLAYIGITTQRHYHRNNAHSVKTKECLWTHKSDMNSCDILCGQSVIQIRFHPDMHKIGFGLTV